jgi:hypothetical protein
MAAWRLTLYGCYDASSTTRTKRSNAGLDALLGAVERPSARTELRDALTARNAVLCERIRSGDIDPLTATTHIRQTVHDKLMVTNPAWLQE